MAHAVWTPLAEDDLEEILFQIRVVDGRPLTARRNGEGIQAKTQDTPSWAVWINGQPTPNSMGSRLESKRRDDFRLAKGLFMSLTLDLTSDEVTEIKRITRLQDDAAAVTKAAREYLRLTRLRELKAVSGKVDFDDQSTQLESLELSEIGFPK
jgi:hypothetical protein